MINLPSATSRRAFTLIELVVVIAVIAVLAALLVPTISMLRKSARTAVCHNNLRQLSLASIAYTIDHDGCLPISEWPDSVPYERRFWGVQLSSYMVNLGTSEYVPGKRPPAPFACPE